MPGTRIRRQLMSMMLLTSTIVLALSCTAFIVYQYVLFKSQAISTLQTLGSTIATNSTAALAFVNADDASAILLALKAEPQIEVAALYDDGGNIFAEYRRETNSAAPPKPHKDGYRFEGVTLVGYQAVAEVAGRRLGTLYLRSDLSALRSGLRWYGVMVLAVFAVSLALAYALARQLQRQISTPIVALADVALAISDRQDFRVRAPELARGYEINHLTQAFNQMLTRIDKQLGRLDLLQRITRAIAERQDLPSIFHVVLGTLEESMPIAFAAIARQDDEQAVLTLANVGARSREVAARAHLAENARIPISSNALSKCLLGELVYEPDLPAVDLPLARVLAGAGLGSFVMSPLVIETKVFGVLIAARADTSAFTSGDCEFLRQLSEHVALAVHQAQLYEALKQAYDDLRQSQHTVLQQERLRALGQMASGIAHDINNAISPVALYTEGLLEREKGLSDRGREYLQTIQRAIDDVATTVSRMREFYRNREPELNLRPLDMNSLIKQVLDLTRPRWFDVSQERGVMIELKTEFATDLPVVMGAESEMRDALTNLVFNAVDAMPAGGTLTLRTRTLVRQDVEVPESVRLVTVEVSDTGIGMDEETKQRCLEPFFTTKGERGTGLGLAMVYGMIRRHSADLEIDSAPGQGTTVRLIFAVYEAASLATARFPAVQMPTRRLRILIIDDDPLLIKALSDILEADGHRITAADGGEAGIEQFTRVAGRDTRFDLVITDLGMPYVDGRKVAATIKQRSPATPVVMLTGWGQRLVADNEVPPHVDRILSKPPRIYELRLAIAELTSDASPAAQSQ